MTDLQHLIRSHLDYYPESDILDIYKLIHQATFGVGHIVHNRSIELEWLEHDISAILPDANAVLLESVSVDDTWVRLHLRPFLAAGGDSHALLEAMIRSGSAVNGNLETIEANWNEFVRLVKSDAALGGRLSLPKTLLFGQKQKQYAWPSTPHSPAYIRAYQPFYRVILTEEANRICS